jgi:hypothetical protein
VTSIGFSSFANCVSLETVTGASGLTDIPSHLFYSCSKLSAFKIGPSVTSIGSGAFYGCASVTSVTFPEAVTMIDDGAFAGCAALTEIRFLGDCPEFGNKPFSAVTATGYHLDKNSTWNSDTLINYGGRIYWESYKPGPYIAAGTCSDTLNWVLSDDGVLTVSGIGSMDDFPEKAAPWASYTDHIANIVIEEGVTKIGEYAFAYCQNAESAIIPTTVTDLGAGAFLAYGPEMEITFVGAAPVINEKAFGSGKDIYLRCYYPANDPSWTRDVLMPERDQNRMGVYGGYVIWESDTALTSKWGYSVVAAYDKQTKTLTLSGSGSTGLWGNLQKPWAKYQTEVKSVVVEGYVNQLVTSDFQDHTALEQVQLSENVVWLGGSVFKGCGSLKRIVIPAQVTGIDMRTFADCTALTEVVFTGNAPYINSTSFANVNASAFYPAENTSWTAAKLQNYGGTLIWQPKEV